MSSACFQPAGTWRGSGWGLLGALNRAKAERDYDEEVMFQAYAGLIEGR